MLGICSNCWAYAQNFGHITAICLISICLKFWASRCSKSCRRKSVLQGNARAVNSYQTPFCVVLQILNLHVARQAAVFEGGRRSLRCNVFCVCDHVRLLKTLSNTFEVLNFDTFVICLSPLRFVQISNYFEFAHNLQLLELFEVFECCADAPH